MIESSLAQELNCEFQAVPTRNGCKHSSRREGTGTSVFSFVTLRSWTLYNVLLVRSYCTRSSIYSSENLCLKGGFFALQTGNLTPNCLQTTGSEVFSRKGHCVDFIQQIWLPRAAWDTITGLAAERLSSTQVQFPDLFKPTYISGFFFKTHGLNLIYANVPFPGGCSDIPVPSTGVALSSPFGWENWSSRGHCVCSDEGPAVSKSIHTRLSPSGAELHFSVYRNCFLGN